MEELLNIFVAWVTLFSFVMFIFSFIAFWRFKHRRLLYIAIAFCFFFIKGIISTISLMSEYIANLYGFTAIVIDMIILFLLSFSVLR
ncbi:MAG: hypothetical protein AB1779_10815 [Candidatus Thermoplasmatota archaeon]